MLLELTVGDAYGATFESVLLDFGWTGGLPLEELRYEKNAAVFIPMAPCSMSPSRLGTGFRFSFLKRRAKSSRRDPHQALQCWNQMTRICPLLKCISQVNEDVQI